MEETAPLLGCRTQFQTKKGFLEMIDARFPLQGRMIWAVVSIVSALWMAACGSSPIPGEIRAGTTFTIMIPRPESNLVTSSPDMVVGYGRASQGYFSQSLRSAAPGLADFQTGLPSASDVPVSDSVLEDFQRGETLIKIYNASSAYWLPTRYITRLHTSPASPVGLHQPMILMGDDCVETGFGCFPVAVPNEGQTIALVDVPVNVPPGTYEFVFTTIRRDPASGDFVPVAAFQTAFTSLYVLPADQGPGAPAPSPTALSGSDTFLMGISGANDALEHIVPRPGLFLTLMAEDTPEEPDPTIGAATIEIDYPAELIDVEGVVNATGTGSGAVIVTRTEDIPGQPADCSRRARLHVNFADMNGNTQMLNVVFAPKDATQNSCFRPILMEDFSINELRVYSVNGNLVPGEAIPTKIF